MEPYMKVLKVYKISGVGIVITVEFLKPTVIPYKAEFMVESLYGKNYIYRNNFKTSWKLTVKSMAWSQEYTPDNYKGDGHIFPIGEKIHMCVGIYPNTIYAGDLLLSEPQVHLPYNLQVGSLNQCCLDSTSIIFLEPKPKKKPLTLVEILEEIKDSPSSNGLNECIICCKNTACILFNCGHVKTCVDCSLKIMKSENKKCAYCRADVTFIHKAYL